MTVVIAVEVFDFPAVEVGGFDVFGCTNTLILDCALGDLAQFELHLGPQVTGGVVIGIGYDEQFPVDHDGLSATNFTGAHGLFPSKTAKVSEPRRLAEGEY